MASEEAGRIAEQFRALRLARLDALCVCVSPSKTSLEQQPGMLRAALSLMSALPCKPKKLWFRGWSATSDVIREVKALSDMPWLEHSEPEEIKLTLGLRSCGRVPSEGEEWPLAQLPKYIPRCVCVCVCVTQHGPTCVCIIMYVLLGVAVCVYVVLYKRLLEVCVCVCMCVCARVCNVSYALPVCVRVCVCDIMLQDLYCFVTCRSYSTWSVEAGDMYSEELTAFIDNIPTDRTVTTPLKIKVIGKGEEWANTTNTHLLKTGTCPFVHFEAI